MLRCKSCLFTTTLKPPRPLQIEIITILISSRDRFTAVIDSDLENIRMGLKCLFGSVFIVFIVTLNQVVIFINNKKIFYNIPVD